MNLETSKITLEVTDNKVSISDRMTMKVSEIIVFLVVTSSIAIFILGLTGIIYSLLFSSGYILFRYFAWVFWKRIEIDFKNRRLTVTDMVLNNRKSTEILTNQFDPSKLILREYEQSGMKRALIQYKNHKVNDLLLLTHPADIDVIREQFMKNHNPL